MSKFTLLMRWLLLIKFTFFSVHIISSIVHNIDLFLFIFDFIYFLQCLVQWTLFSNNNSQSFNIIDIFCVYITIWCLLMLLILKMMWRSIFCCCWLSALNENLIIFITNIWLIWIVVMYLLLCIKLAVRLPVWMNYHIL